MQHVIFWSGLVYFWLWQWITSGARRFLFLLAAGFTAGLAFSAGPPGALPALLLVCVALPLALRKRMRHYFTLGRGMSLVGLFLLAGGMVAPGAFLHPIQWMAWDVAPASMLSARHSFLAGFVVLGLLWAWIIRSFGRLDIRWRLIFAWLCVAGLVGWLYSLSAVGTLLLLVVGTAGILSDMPLIRRFFSRTVLTIRAWREVLGVVLEYHYKQYLALYVLSIASAVLEAVSISLIFPLLAALTDRGATSMPAGVGRLMSWLLAMNLETMAFILFIVFTAKNVVKFMIEYGNARITNEIRGAWMKQLFNKYTSAHYLFFIRSRHGVLLHNLFDLTDQAMSGLRQLVNMCLYGISTLIVIGAMTTVSWQLTLLSGIGITLLYVVLNRPLLIKAMELGGKRLVAYQEVHAVPAEGFKGMREIKTYSAQPQLSQHYQNVVDFMVRLRVKLNFYQLLPSVFPETVLVTFLLCALVVVNRWGTTPIATLLPMIGTYTYAAYRLFVNASTLVKDAVVVSSQWPSVRYLADALQSRAYPEVTAGEATVPKTAQSLHFQNVSFSYDATHVVSGVTLTFAPSTITAIVGRSGAGKSTLADLVIRLYEPTDGVLLYGTESIQSYSLSAWRSIIGFVSQDTFLFHGSIRENISFGLGANTSQAAIEESARGAGAHDFIAAMPQGYDTLVGERGARLSGGQRQRIAIARALIRQPRLLILDEATSALDPETERAVLETILLLRSKMSIILITHRLAVAQRADRIVVLDQGRVVEEGTHQTLMARRGAYALLVNT